MEDRKEKNAPWLSVPQFGDWDQKGQVPDYSLDFSKIREMRKQNKRDPSRASLGNEEELITGATTNATTTHSDHHHYNQNHSPTAVRLKRRKLKERYFTGPGHNTPNVQYTLGKEGLSQLLQLLCESLRFTEPFDMFSNFSVMIMYWEITLSFHYMILFFYFFFSLPFFFSDRDGMCM